MKICFVSYEIHPVTPGGCGVLLHQSAQILLQQGHHIIFLFDMSRQDFAKFDPAIYPHPANCRAYFVEDLCADIPLRVDDFSNRFLWRAYRFHWAAQKATHLEQPDVIEFFDYNGAAHYALAAKLTQSLYPDTHLTVRLHNSDQLMNLHQAYFPTTIDYYLLYALEHSALALAETVLYPSPAYLNEAYKPHYEPWLGQTVHSKPGLLKHPQLYEDRSQEKTRILFYGRLFGFKGVDLFVDAAVKVLSEEISTTLCFTLVGYDAEITPDRSETYQSYLRKRIPKRYQDRFEFLGQLNWSQLEDLLPEVLGAVFPGYLESFCYAAHELYAAGVPIIINNIPAFRDYFKHRENALLFDGTVTDLARQMRTLWRDEALRERLKQPYSVVDDPLGDFYEGPFVASWIHAQESPASPCPSLLICILDNNNDNDDPAALGRTLETLDVENPVNRRVIVLTEPANQAGSGSNALWFLGRLYQATDVNGQPLSAVGLETAETLLLLRAGDIVAENYLSLCLSVLARQPEISFAGAWRRIHVAQNVVRLDTFPLDAALELIPFENLPLFNRMVMRTEPGRLLIELFDPRLMQLGEVGYLWDIETRLGPGVLIPECLLELNEIKAAAWNASLLSYLIARDVSPYRKTRLTNYLASLQSARDPGLTAKQQPRYSEEIARIVQTIGDSKIGRLVGQNPFLVKWSKALLRRFRRSAAAG